MFNVFLQYPDMAVQDPFEVCFLLANVYHVDTIIISVLGIYNIWLQERLSRQFLKNLVEATTLRVRMEGTVHTLLPPHIVNMISNSQSPELNREDAADTPSSKESSKKRSIPMLQHDASMPRMTLVSDLQTSSPFGLNVSSLDGFTEYLPQVCMLMADIQGFTSFASNLDAQGLFSCMNMLFTKFDEICSAFGIRKIETIGDAYWCAVGLERPADHNDAASIVGMALSMQEQIRELIARKELPDTLGMRIGLHVSPCIGGILGKRNPRYHLFGQGVDVLMNIEQCGSIEGVVMSHAFVSLLAAGQGLEDQLKEPGWSSSVATLRSDSSTREVPCLESEESKLHARHPYRRFNFGPTEMVRKWRDRFDSGSLIGLAHSMVTARLCNHSHPQVHDSTNAWASGGMRAGSSSVNAPGAGDTDEQEGVTQGRLGGARNARVSEGMPPLSALANSSDFNASLSAGKLGRIGTPASKKGSVLRTRVAPAAWWSRQQSFTTSLRSVLGGYVVCVCVLREKAWATTFEVAFCRGNV